jgi:hypothetical protein
LPFLDETAAREVMFEYIDNCFPLRSKNVNENGNRDEEDTNEDD